jgi:hypothetical protein
VQVLYPTSSERKKRPVKKAILVHPLRAAQLSVEVSQNNEEETQGEKGTGVMTMQLEYVMDIQVSVGKPLEVGRTPQGRRRIIPITGGTFEGPRLKGIVLPGGADWQVIDANYHTQLEARYSLQTDDGVVIAVINRGVRSGPKEVMQRLIQGEEASPAEYYFRTVPVFEVESEKYDWLNHYLFVATAERHPNAVMIRVFQIL